MALISPLDPSFHNLHRCADSLRRAIPRVEPHMALTSTRYMSGRDRICDAIRVGCGSLPLSDHRCPATPIGVFARPTPWLPSTDSPHARQAVRCTETKAPHRAHAQRMRSDSTNGPSPIRRTSSQVLEHAHAVLGAIPLVDLGAACRGTSDTRHRGSVPVRSSWSQCLMRHTVQ